MTATAQLADERFHSPLASDNPVGGVVLFEEDDVYLGIVV